MNFRRSDKCIFTRLPRCEVCVALLYSHNVTLVSIYSLHSVGDGTVPVMHARTSKTHLRELRDTPLGTPVT